MLKYSTALACFILVGYGFVKAFPLIAGPSLTITAPSIYDGTSTSEVVRVEGRAARAIELTLDGAPLAHDQEGNFSSVITVPRGGAILTFAASDQFGRTVTATRELFVP